MAVKINLTDVLKIAPNARSSYRNAFSAGQPVFDRYHVSDLPLRVAHFMAQILHESGGLSIQFENLNYSAERLPQVWPSRFIPKGTLNSKEYAHNPEKLANMVYGNRMGNTDPGDGFKFRGRGLIQLTGKDSYREATTILRNYNPAAPDFTLTPDDVISTQWCIEVALSEWTSKGCNQLADGDQLKTITRKINGGYIGLAQRAEWLKVTKNIWH